MIIGIGTDIVAIERLEKAIERRGNDFLLHFLTPQEMAAACNAGATKLQHIAGRWAAKEAVSKMLGCGIGRKCTWYDIGIRQQKSGAPEVVLTGAGAETARELGIKHIFLSISHEVKYATATVIAEK